MLNIFLSIILIFALIWGFVRGAVRQVFSIAGCVFGVVAVRLFAGRMAQWLSEKLGTAASWPLAFSYILIFFAVVIACTLLGRLFHEMLKDANLGFVNRLAGGVLSLLKYALIIGLLLNLYSSLDKNGWLISAETRAKTKLYEPLRKFGECLLPYVDELKQLELKDLPIPFLQQEAIEI
ncbi:MAG: CvpA family protein [Bacteroidales bacterium]|jgi:membrane protein required for colicin V production|nr:CvpA family protein [Bacteroidales bacterium]